MTIVDNYKINIGDNLLCIKGMNNLGFYKGKTYKAIKFKDTSLGISGTPYGVWFKDIGFYFYLNPCNKLGLYLWKYFETVNETRTKKLEKIEKIKIT